MRFTICCIDFSPQSYCISRSSGNVTLVRDWIGCNNAELFRISGLSLVSNQCKFDSEDGLGCETLKETAGEITDGVTKTNLKNIKTIHLQQKTLSNFQLIILYVQKLK